MSYNDARDILLQREETAPTGTSSGHVHGWWRVMSPVAVTNPFYPWATALEHARGHAKRTGGDVYRQVGNATPELVE
jgi:hypothetical protein